MSTCQWKGSAPRGAVRTQRLSSGGPSKRACERPQGGAEHRRPASPSSSKPGRRRGRTTRSSNGEREAQGQISAASSSIATRRSRRRTSSTRTSLSRPPPVRALAVGAEPLALARDRGRHEAQRVELGVGVLERGAGAAALVDDQLHVGGARRGRASARARSPTAAASSPSSSSAIAVTCRGVLTITSWTPLAGREEKRSGSPAAPRGAAAGRRPGEGARLIGLGAPPAALVPLASVASAG